jgi:CheY-like chemotaxis protein
MDEPRPTVLVLDDDPDHALMLQISLESFGFDTRVADSAQSAEAILRSDRHDAIVADLALTDGSGADLMRALGPLRPRVRIMVTGYDLADIDGADAEQFDTHFVKPVTASQLAGALRERLVRPPAFAAKAHARDNRGAA